MNFIKKGLLGLVAILMLMSLVLIITGNGFILTAVKRTYLAGHITSNINDHNVFAVRTIKSDQHSLLKKHPEFNKRPLPTQFIEELEKDNTAAFLILKDNQIISEHYFNGYNDRSKTNSFSMAKTVTTLLLGIAIDEGYVRDLDQPIVDFIPEFSNDPLGKKATVGHFSLMNSGYEWDENYYTPFSPTVELYYGSDVRDFLLDGEFSAEPGSFWEYSSASTQVLGIFLLRALQKAGAADSLSDYLSKKIWQPMGMNDDALWHLDNSGMELVYCCINTNARNFAKLGALLQNNGAWEDQQIVPPEFIKKMLQPAGESYYGLSTWLELEKQPNFHWYSGHLGQFIISVPSQNMVIVRLGENTNSEEDAHEETLPRYVEVAASVL